MPIPVDRSNFDLKIQGKTHLIENGKEEPLLKLKKKKRYVPKSFLHGDNNVRSY